MAKPISIALAPNNEKDDVRLAAKLLFRPWKWKEGKTIEELENEFRKYLGVRFTSSFNSGRSGLYAILKALELPTGSEVLLQAFTCNAASNPVIWAGLRPVYVDCLESDFNINPDDLRRKIGPNSRAVMVQHTFGLPADMDAIKALCKQYNLILIEDCAHALGATYQGQKVGTIGDVSFFSFGRDKIISSVYGGMVATNSESLGVKIKKVRNEFDYPSYFWIKQQLLHPVIMNRIVLPVYNVLDLGKIFLVLSQWLGLLSRAVNWQEKHGEKPSYFPKRLPNALAILALHQFKKLDRFSNHRKEIVDFYNKEIKNPFLDLPKQFPERVSANLRYNVKRNNMALTSAHEIIYEAWHKKNILVGDWYTTVIAPFDTDLESVGYKVGTCPVAEALAKRTFNLPTHINISKKDAQKIVDFLNSFE